MKYVKYTLDIYIYVYALKRNQPASSLAPEKELKDN